ncbi:unnamed protein product [Ectocarpus sp. 12 AP-2014]
MGGAPEDLASTAAGSSGVGHQGDGGGNKSSSGRSGGGPGVTTTTTTTLLDGPDLKYSSPLGLTCGVLRPTPQERFVVGGNGGGGSSSGGSSSSSSGATRIERRSPSNSMTGTT